MPTLPDTMTAVAITGPGGLDKLAVVTRPLPVPRDKQILVRVRAAGVNRPDVLQRLGHHPPPAGAPEDIPGLEIAGEVAALGPGASRHALGDAVTALVPGGGYGQYCAVHETNALPVPNGFSMVEAAAIPETFFTVWPNLFDRGRLSAGETLLIHGGTSGIGTVAIQLGHAFGATVIATAGSADKCAACVELGANQAINYREEDFVARVGEITRGHGADVIVDLIGGDYVARNYAAAAEDGRIVQIGTQHGSKAEVPIGLLMVKRLTHTGSTLRSRPVAFKAAVAEALHRNVWPLFAARTVAPVIDFDLSARRGGQRPGAHGSLRPYRQDRADRGLMPAHHRRRRDPFPLNVRLLLATRTVRSIGQGVTVASFALYLHALGYTGAAIGTVLMAGLTFGALLTAIVGPLSDRRGRRGLLLVYEVSAAVAALAVMLTRNHVVLIAAATIAGFGRGANGAAGPFAPVEQAWLARELQDDARRRALSLNATLGFAGMALGAALVALPSLLGHGFSDIDSYRLLFLVPLFGSLAAVALLVLTDERHLASPAPSEASRSPAAAHITRQENRQLRRLATANAINGLAIGIIGPLIALWFAQRFAEGPASIGPAMAVTFVLGALGSVLNGHLSARMGAVRSVLLMRSIGVLLLVATPFAPVFGVAVALYGIRAGCNQGTAGARQAVAADLTRAERRGLAASVQSLSLQIPRAAGPILGGWLIHAGQFVTPFLIAAALQVVYLVLYGRFFAALDQRAAAAPATHLPPA